MASDASYLSFLEKANQDPSSGTSQATQSKAEGGFVSTKTVDQNVKEVPDVLKSVDVEYVSDTDEPFEAVVLEWEGAGKGEWPSDDQFRTLISTSESSSSISKAEISTLSTSSFDPKNQYVAVLRAVREAASGSDAEVKIYQLGLGSTRAEYWVLALDGKGGRIVGLKARAVES
ncbi:hypothetical protein FQN54_005218 [Arachnomyces sp. PD_36]|nr:hypothetical protein FQN54_005218 [Arachnomyces sp. PD_36]